MSARGAILSSACLTIRFEKIDPLAARKRQRNENNKLDLTDSDLNRIEYML